MSNEKELISGSEIPLFAATVAATSYKLGKEGFVDLMFMRPTFILGDVVPSSSGSENLTRSTEMVMNTVGSVTLTQIQAEYLISALQDQLNRLKEI